LEGDASGAGSGGDMFFARMRKGGAKRATSCPTPLPSARDLIRRPRIGARVIEG